MKSCIFSRKKKTLLKCNYLSSILENYKNKQMKTINVIRQKFLILNNYNLKKKIVTNQYLDMEEKNC